MNARAPDGTVWGRPEAVDSLGWRPGRGRRVVLALLGAASLAAGAYLGTSAVAQTPTGSGPAAPLPGQAQQGFPPPGTPAGPGGSVLDEATCASIGVLLQAGRYPAEGVPEASVVRLYRSESGTETDVLVPEAHVLRVAPNPDGSVALSVLVRTSPEDGRAAEIAGAGAAGELVASVLYDVDPIEVLDRCRGE